MFCSKAVVLVVLIAPLTMLAGEWQITGAAGFGLYHPLTYRAPAGEAQEGIGPRYALAVSGGRLLSGRFALEAAYSFQDGDFELSSGGRKTAFDANAHAVHADLLCYFRQHEAAVRPYFVAGGGAKFYHGIEAMNPRPLGEFGSFRDGVDTRPMAEFGGGVEWAVRAHWGLRLDIRDYTTPFPSSVIVPAPGSNLSGWLHDLVATVGITLR